MTTLPIFMTGMVPEPQGDLFALLMPGAELPPAPEGKDVEPGFAALMAAMSLLQPQQAVPLPPPAIAEAPADAEAVALLKPVVPMQPDVAAAPGLFPARMGVMAVESTLLPGSAAEAPGLAAEAPGLAAEAPGLWRLPDRPTVEPAAVTGDQRPAAQVTPQPGSAHIRQMPPEVLALAETMEMPPVGVRTEPAANAADPSQPKPALPTLERLQPQPPAEQRPVTPEAPPAVTPELSPPPPLPLRAQMRTYHEAAQQDSEPVAPVIPAAPVIAGRKGSPVQPAVAPLERPARAGNPAVPVPLPVFEASLTGLAQAPDSGPEEVQALLAPASTPAADPVVRQLRVELSPPELGAVMVRVEARGDEVAAEIVVARDTARVVLEAAETQVRQALADTGLTVQSFRIIKSDIPAQAGPNQIAPPLSRGLEPETAPAPGSPAPLPRPDVVDRPAVLPVAEASLADDAGPERLLAGMAQALETMAGDRPHPATQPYHSALPVIAAPTEAASARVVPAVADAAGTTGAGLQMSTSGDGSPSHSQPRAPQYAALLPTPVPQQEKQPAAPERRTVSLASWGLDVYA